MNPELLRNVWHELTWRRLIAMPLMLGVVLWVSSFAGGASVTAGILFIVFTVLWGTHQAAAAVADEVAEGTWDWQRLSTLTAWQLIWGKLFGATLFSWYGALICLVVRFLILLPENGFLAMAHVTLFLICGALLGQAMAFLLGLQTVRLRGHRRRIGTLVSQIIGVIIGAVMISTGSFLPGGMLGWFYKIRLAPEVVWYGLTFTAPTVATITLALSLGWTLLGAHRLMVRELSYRTRPWAWPSFVAFACVYVAGFEPAGSELGSASLVARLSGPLVVATGVSALLTYAALFWDDKDPVLFRRLIRLFEARDWKAFLAYWPSWLVSFGITTLLTIVLLFMPSDPASPVVLWAALIAGLLFMLRDMTINLYFWLAPNHNRANLITIIVLVLLYLPSSFEAFEPIAYMFIPFAPAPWYTVICAGLFEFGVMVLLVTRRWRARFELAAA